MRIHDLKCLCVAVALLFVVTSVALATPRTFTIDAEDASHALLEFGRQSAVQILFASEKVRGITTNAVHGDFEPIDALKVLLKGTRLTVSEKADGVLVVDIGAIHSASNRTTVEDPVGTPSDSLRVTQADQTSAKVRAGQYSDKDSSLNRDSTQQATMDDIIVTAQKRSERAQDVPASLSVLVGADLEDQGAVQISDYAKQIPGLTSMGTSSPGRGEYVLRGVSSGTGSSSLVGIYLDDIPMSPSSSLAVTSSGQISFDPDLADIDHIEVLRGAQSTLYGASSMGGVIKFVTKQPDFSEFSASARLDGSQVDGGGDGYGIRGSANIPFSDSVALRASAFARRDPGFIDNIFSQVRDVNHDIVEGGRVSLRVKIADNLETTLSGLYQKIDSADRDTAFLDGNLHPLGGSRDFSSPFHQRTSIENKSINDTTTLGLDFATLTNVISYTSVSSRILNDNGGTFSFFLNPAAPPEPANDSLYASVTPHETRLSDELRLVSKPGRLEWLLGGFYTQEKENPDTIIFRGTNPQGVTLPPANYYFNFLTYSNRASITERAIFGDLTYHLTSQLEATVGMRYASNHQNSAFMEDGLFVGSGDSGGGQSSDSAESYLATVSYKPTTDVSIYARAASAYRPGGPNILTPQAARAGAPTSFSPDRLWNYEIGTKGSFFDHALSYSVSAFHMRWTGIQLTVDYIVDGQSQGLIFANASSAKSDGAEATIQLNPLRGLTVDVNAAYTDAVLTSTPPPGTIAFDGDRLPYSSRLTGSVVVDYRAPQIGKYAPRAGLTYAYHGDAYTDFSTASASFRLPSYQTLDLRAGVEWSNYGVTARVDNVANKYAFLDAGYSNAVGFPVAGVLLKPRTYGVSLAVHF